MSILLGCKKDGVAPQATETPFDIRQYVLVKKESNNSGWVTNIQLTTFEAQSKCTVFTELGALADNGYNYQYENGTLKLFYGNSLKNEIRIENNAIKSTTVNTPGASFKLIKVPKDNPLNGNTYSGGWKAEGSNLTYIASLKFTDSHYSEAAINLPEPNKSYNLFKYTAVYEPDVAKDVYTLWVVIDDKLEGYRTTYNGNTKNRVTGVFIKK